MTGIAAKLSARLRSEGAGIDFLHVRYKGATPEAMLSRWRYRT